MTCKEKYFISSSHSPLTAFYFLASMLSIWLEEWTYRSNLLVTEDEDLVTNSLESIVNLEHLTDLRIFSLPKQSYIKIK